MGQADRLRTGVWRCGYRIARLGREVQTGTTRLGSRAEVGKADILGELVLLCSVPCPMWHRAWCWQGLYSVFCPWAAVGYHEVLSSGKSTKAMILSKRVCVCGVLICTCMCVCMHIYVYVCIYIHDEHPCSHSFFIRKQLWGLIGKVCAA